MRQKLWLITMAVSLLVLTSCEVEVPGGGFLTATPVETGPTPTPVIIGRPEVKPTNTPIPLPPSPTPRPTFTPIVTAGDEETPEVTTPPAADMVLIPAGPFIMGSDSDDPDEAPQQEVDLPAFEIDLFEVTNAQFAAFVEATGHQTDAEKGGETGWRGFYTEDKDNHPVVKVSWNDAVAYCQWVGKRLPTEAEWEKAARGTDGRIYPWGDEWDPARVNSYQSGYRGTTSVGSFADGASPYGVFDMAGNVWEWTSDWYLPYPGSNYQDPYFGEENKVTRGGAWFEEPPQVRASNRNCTCDIAANDDLGFRCAR
ncbi:MAG: formylglycine-generating enzyme family protein [Chloroflexota bacterium]|nr:formylglycine-generating enzyme family protein [Chloroflexota bacterium]